jgi:hypothetical protein
MNTQLTNANILDLLEGMILQQRAKVMAQARELVPGITEEDARNPHDFPALRASDTFNFEDGILAGLMAAQMALRAEINQKKH